MIRLNDIVDKVNSYLTLEDFELDLVKRAYVYSAKVHAGQKRVSGEPYLSHPLEVSSILADLKLDVHSIATGLLHDTVEDTLATMEDIEDLFGNEIAFLVDGTTKISKLKYVSRLENQAESFRKLILATAKDVRVVLIKLADRLHNMRTLEYLPEESRRRISQETLDIYAPLSHRLGISWITSELQDLAFQFSRPEDYKKISDLVCDKSSEWNNYLEDVKGKLNQKLSELRIGGAVSGRFKNIFSIYNKMMLRGKDFDSVYDVLAFRIIARSENECYQILGAVHEIWKPVPGRIKDYIALPKPNGYKSLHTTVFGPYGEQMEIQIRTQDMHELAEYGIAAHWNYKENGSNGSLNNDVYSSIRQLFEHKDIKDPSEFIDAIKGELISNVIYVFTPDSDLVELPQESTPLDFAYLVHTDIGNRCSKAFVNRKLVPLDYKLKTGDSVAIITAQGNEPTRDWLQFVVTAKAKTKIRNWLRNEENKKAEEVGRSICERKLKKSALNLNDLIKKDEINDVINKLGFSELSSFYRAVGFGNISANEMVKIFNPEDKDISKAKESRIEKILNTIRRPEYKNAVTVKGYSDIMIRFGKCCLPLPGEELTGYITRGKGITVHKFDCSTLMEIDPERKIDVKWDSSFEEVMPAKVYVVCADEPGMLSKLTNAFSSNNINLLKVEMDRFELDKARGVFDITVSNIKQLQAILSSIRKLKGVISADRVYESIQ